MVMLAVAGGVANVAPKTDPIFAAIKVCVEAERVDAEATIWFALERFKDEYGSNEPDAIPKAARQMWRQTEGLEKFFEGRRSSHDEVDGFVDAMLRRHRGSPDFASKEKDNPMQTWCARRDWGTQKRTHTAMRNVID